MDQKQAKQVKKYRILKVLFYFLGFPLLLLTTFIASVKYIGSDPFVGNHLWVFPILEAQVFNHFQEIISSPALYGVYVIAAIWLFVSIVHIILSKVCKSSRARMLLVIVIMLIALLGTMFLMDYAFEKNISAMIDDVNAGKYADGVTVQDYKTQLSYYRNVTSDIEKKGLVGYYELIEKVNRYEKVYAVDMQGYDKVGAAGNTGNTVAYYDELIDDEGNRGVDVSYEQDAETQRWILSLEPDGIEGNDHVVVRLKPNSKGQLEINGKVYSHYFYVEKTPITGNEATIYVWYIIDMLPSHKMVEKKGVTTGFKTQPEDGIYGEGLYNPNGMLADGYIPSLYNVIEILEDYYQAEPGIAKILAKHSDEAAYDSFETWHAAVIQDAELRREEYYTGVSTDENGETCSPFIQELYKSEMTTAQNRFSLSRGRMDALLAEVGALLGDNGLFDLLLKSESGLIASVLGDTLTKLEEGMDLVSLIGMDASTKDTVCQVISDIFGKPCTGLVIQLKYVDSDKGHFYFALKNDKSDPDSAAIMDLDFSNEVLGLETDERFLYKDALGNWAVNTDYAFDIDHVSKLLSNALTFILNDFALFDTNADGINDQTLLGKVDELLGGTLGTILGLVGGLLNLEISDGNSAYTAIAGLLDGLLGDAGAFSYDPSTGKWKFDIMLLLGGLLDSLYYYQSPVIKNVYEFYVDPEAEEWEQEAQRLFADYDRAYFEGAVWAPTMGSAIIGDELGGTNDMNAVFKYTADFGLTDLASVQQLKLDLSYQPVYYPLFTARDMILTFSGFVILFYFLSFVAAEKELEYANGTLIVKKKKSKKDKYNQENDEVADGTPVEQDSEEEIKLEENTEEAQEEIKLDAGNESEEDKQSEEDNVISLDDLDSTKEVG